MLKAPDCPVVILGKVGDMGPALGLQWNQVEPQTVEKPSCRKGLPVYLQQ